MSTLFEQPLHGVACEPFCTFDAQYHRHRVRIEEVQIDKAPGAEPLWMLEDKGLRYTSCIKLYQEHQDYIIDVLCEGKGTFRIDEQGIGIDWQQDGTAAAHYFQTWALACWLEQKGVLCLHANALAIPNSDDAIAIMAPSRTGKTTLSMALVAQGFELMTDDMVALYPAHKASGSYEIYPGWPEFRMWPDAVEHASLFAGGHLFVRNELVHSRFAKRKLKLHDQQVVQAKKRLRAIYVLERKDAEAGSETLSAEHASNLHPEESIRLSKVSKAVATIQLLQNSILGSALKAMGMEQRRLKALADFVTDVEVRHLSYQSGFDHLPEVAKSLMQAMSNR